MIAQFGICQNGSETSEAYPKKIVHKRDTVVAFTLEQTKKIQLTKIELEQTKELNDSLKTQIDKDSLLITNLRTVVKSYDRERELSSLVIRNDSLMLKQNYLQIEKLEKNLKRSRTGNKILGGGLLTGLGIVLGILIAN